MVSRGIAAVRYTPRMPVYRVQYVKAFNRVTGDVINSPVTNEVATAIRRSAIDRTRLDLAKQAGCRYEDVVFVRLRASVYRRLERHVKIADPVPNLGADRVVPFPSDRTTDFMVWYNCGLPDGSHHPGNALLPLREDDDPAQVVTAAHRKVHPEATVAVETYYPDQGGCYFGQRR